MHSIKQKQKISKYISYVLRHKPEEIGLKLNRAGWADTAELIELTNRNVESNGFILDLPLLEEVVAEDAKSRYAFSPDKKQIRANQGHSVSVDLGLKNKIPPVILYHGTSVVVVDIIRKEGLKPLSRHAVHLSGDTQTAKVVGARRKGESVILEINSKAMFADGYKFQCSENGVWLTESVPPQYIKFP